MEPFFSSNSFLICSTLLCGMRIPCCKASDSSSLISNRYFRYACFFTLPPAEPAASSCSLIFHCSHHSRGLTFLWCIRQNLDAANFVRSLHMHEAQHSRTSTPYLFFINRNPDIKIDLFRQTSSAIYALSAL